LPIYLRAANPGSGEAGTRGLNASMVAEVSVEVPRPPKIGGLGMTCGKTFQKTAKIAARR
jgi:hypothetical protein